MTREEWKTITSVYQLWLEDKGEEDKDAIVASLEEAAMLRKTEEELRKGSDWKAPEPRLTTP
jgi:hypothetical protein